MSIEETPTTEVNTSDSHIAALDEFVHINDLISPTAAMVGQASLENPICKQVWELKYKRRNEQSLAASIDRVVDAICYPDDGTSHFYNNTSQAIQNRLFLPAGRILAGAGLDEHDSTLMNCYVMGELPDSLDGIMNTLHESAITTKYGGGIGIDFSTLRPKGAEVSTGAYFAGGPVAFMGLWDSLGHALEAGGNRRGGKMATMRASHPDILEFITCKSTAGKLTSFNISVLVDDELMSAVEADEDYTLWHRSPRQGERDTQERITFIAKESAELIETVYMWDRIPARVIWNAIMQNTYMYSEPGVIFIDKVNRANPLNYIEHITATNPCVTGDTEVLTDTGYHQIKDLVGKKVNVWNGQEFSEVEPFSTRENDVLEIQFTNGNTVRCTPYHKWILKGGERFEAKDLQIGDQLEYMEFPVIKGTESYPIDAYSQGFYSGDGTKNSECSNLYKHNEGIKSRLIGKITPRNCDSQPGDRWTHGQMLDKSFVPINGTIDYCINWLAGLLDADGCVLKKGSSSHVIELSAKDRYFIAEVGLMLNRLGVNYRSWERGDGGLKKGSNGKEYMCDNTSALMISWKGCHQLVRLGLKCERLKLELFQNAPKGIARVGHKVLAIHSAGREETYCLTEPKRNRFVANGVITSNCGEQPLPPYGACNLGSINLAMMVTDPLGPNANINWKLLDYVTEIAICFLNRVLDVTKYPLLQQETEAKEKRRIGLGITGLADLLATLKVPYDSKQALVLSEAVMSRIANVAYATSAKLAKREGVFPCYAENQFVKPELADEEHDPTMHKVLFNLTEETHQLIKKYGLRNGVLLSIAPTGTISLAFGDVSSGCEPVFSHHVERRIKVKDASNNDTFKSIDTYSWIVRMYAAVYDMPLDQAYENVKMRAEEFPTTEDLDPSDHINMQGVLQAWVDSSISKTVNCPEETTFEELSNVYLQAFKSGCKGCTTYRPSDVRDAVLVSKDEKGKKGKKESLTIDININQESIDKIREQIATDYKRGYRLDGTTYKLRWPSMPSPIFVTINYDGDRPVEVFIASKNDQHNEWSVALSVMISKLLQTGVPAQEVAAQLKEITLSSTPAWEGGKHYGSIISRIGHLLDNHFNGEQPTPEREDILVTTRGGGGAASGGGGGGGRSAMAEPQTPGLGGGHPDDYADLRLHNQDAVTIENSGLRCEACGSYNVVKKEGCAVCNDCGHSKCS